jgi:RHS repeat-associated protein
MRLRSTINRKSVLVVLAICTTAGLFPRAAHGMYDPKHGRWLQRDPIGVRLDPPKAEIAPDSQYADGMNSYEYVRSQPVAVVDPDGTIIVGIRGYLQFLDTSMDQQILQAIQRKVNNRMLPLHNFRETRTQLIGGGLFGAKGEANKLIDEWARRKEREGPRDCGEQIVFVGHSDGATTLFQISHDDTFWRKGSNVRGKWYVAFMGLIDMVRTDWGRAPNKTRNVWLDPGKITRPTEMRAWVQDTGDYMGWIGYRIGFRSEIVPHEDHMSIRHNQRVINEIVKDAASQYDYMFHWHNGDFEW